MKVAVGIDIGGTNTVWGFIDADGAVIEKGTFPTTDHPKAESLVNEAAAQISQVLQHRTQLELIGIGIGAPNGNFFNGTVEFAPNLSWEGIVPLKELFQAHFDLPVWVTNDANAAAIGEMQFGAAQGMNDFLIVTLGTGLGSGFVANGELIYGHDAFAGELGHTIVELDGRQCGCGRKGCLETYASATGIVRTAHLKLASYEGSSSLQQLDTITSKNIAEAAKKGDTLALEIFDYTAQKLGFSLANTVAISSPKAIVLFGGLAHSGDLIVQPTKHYMEQYMLNIFQNKVEILLSSVPEADAAILGAAALVWKQT